MKNIFALALAVLSMPAIAASTLQSFGAVGDGVADDTSAVQAALSSGVPLQCSGKFKITRLVTVNISANISLVGDGNPAACIFNMTSGQSMLYIVEGTPLQPPTYSVLLKNLTVNATTAITAAGPSYTAGIFITYGTGGGTLNGPQPSVMMDNVIVQGSNGGYFSNGIVLYNTNVTKLSHITLIGHAVNLGSGLTYTGSSGAHHTNAILTVEASQINNYFYGIYLPPTTDNTWQGVRVSNTDVNGNAVGMDFEGDTHGTSDQVILYGNQGQNGVVGIQVANAIHVFMSNNYFFAGYFPPLGPYSPMICYSATWNNGVPTNGATTDISHNSCDGGYAPGATIGVNIGGYGDATTMASVVGENTLTNLTKGIQINPGTSGWLINKQATKNVTNEIVNNGTAGANTFVPPLWEPLTYSHLPSCNGANLGQQRLITDAPGTPAYNAVLTIGGGSTIVTAFCNGTAWTAH